MNKVSRVMGALVIAGAALSLTTGAAQAQGLFDFLLKPRPVAPAAAGGVAGVSPIPRETVTFASTEKAGTIIVNAQERRLYLINGDGTALRYGVGVGRPGFQWGGVQRISRKAEWPGWTPPPAMLKRRPELPRHMPGGIENPLGARALYLGSTVFRIHGSNEPHTIGQAVSSGCFRMTNDDVTDLYERVNVGAKVIVIRG